MSFESSEKKRRRKIGVAKAKHQHRDTMTTRYYRTLVKHACRCAARGCRLRPGDEMVYRHDARLTLCVPCADSDPLRSRRERLAPTAPRLGGLRPDSDRR